MWPGTPCNLCVAVFRCESRSYVTREVLHRDSCLSKHDKMCVCLFVEGCVESRINDVTYNSRPVTIYVRHTTQKFRFYITVNLLRRTVGLVVLMGASVQAGRQAGRQDHRDLGQRTLGLMLSLIRPGTAADVDLRLPTPHHSSPRPAPWPLILTQP